MKVFKLASGKPWVCENCHRVSRGWKNPTTIKDENGTYQLVLCNSCWKAKGVDDVCQIRMKNNFRPYYDESGTLQPAPVKDPSLKTAANITTLNDQELTSIKQVCTQLKSACPGLGPLIQNPNNMAVLMRFFQIIGKNQSAITLLRNSLATIKKAMDKDSTTTTGFVSSI